jgi:hypothetical protein
MPKSFQQVIAQNIVEEIQNLLPLSGIAVTIMAQRSISLKNQIKK